MADEEKKEEQKTETSAEEYIKALNELKENTVSKAEYERLAADNKMLIQALKTQSPQKKEDPPKEKIDLSKEANNIIDNGDNMSNLEYCEHAVKFRDACIEQGKKDPFLPTGSAVEITEEMRQKADKFSTIVKECIEYANGDDKVFTNELQRRTEDVTILRNKK